MEPISENVGSNPEVMTQRPPTPTVCENPIAPPPAAECANPVALSPAAECNSPTKRTNNRTKKTNTHTQQTNLETRVIQLELELKQLHTLLVAAGLKHIHTTAQSQTPPTRNPRRQKPRNRSATGNE